MMRPVFYDYPELLKAPCDHSMAFTVGRDLLVAPSPKPEIDHVYDACMPGPGWFDYWTGLELEGETNPTLHSRSSKRCRPRSPSDLRPGRRDHPQTSRDAEHV